MPDEVKLIRYYLCLRQAHLDCLAERFVHIHRHPFDSLRLWKFIQILFHSMLAPVLLPPPLLLSPPPPDYKWPCDIDVAPRTENSSRPMNSGISFTPFASSLLPIPSATHLLTSPSPTSSFKFKSSLITKILVFRQPPEWLI